MKLDIDSPAELGLLLRATRKAKGRRLDDVAQQAGVGHVFVRHAEHGKDSVHLGKVFQVLEELGLRLSIDLDAPSVVEYERLSREGGLKPLKPRAREAV